MLGRVLSLPLRGMAAGEAGREVASGGDLPATPDPREQMPNSIAGLAVAAFPVVMLTAVPHLGPGITFADVAVLTAGFTVAAVLAVLVPWDRLDDSWLLALIGLPIVYVAALNSLTGAGVSPYFAMYAPILAIAGWYLTGKQTVAVTGLMIASEAWRAVALDRSGSLDHLTIALPFDIAIAGIANLTSSWLRGSLIETRRNQVRMALTLDAVRTLGGDPSIPVLTQLRDAAQTIFGVPASVVPLSGRRTETDGLAGSLVSNGGTTVLVQGAHALHAVLRLDAADELSHHDLRLAAILAEAAGRTLDTGADLDRVRALSERDALTGLLNRGALDRDLSAALETTRAPRRGALLFLDLDGFKKLNDVYGHVTGDAVLMRVAGMLRGVVRDGDTVYRYGGDEFAIFLPRAGRDEATQLAERIVALASVSPRRVDDAPVALRLSIGLAVAGRTTTASELLVAADEAMYRAKRDGGGVLREAQEP